jgi:hypothetical protein
MAYGLQTGKPNNEASPALPEMGGIVGGKDKDHTQT